MGDCSRLAKGRRDNAWNTFARPVDSQIAPTLSVGNAGPPPTPSPHAQRPGVRKASDGQPIGLTPKAFDLLVYLVDRAGRLVTKQELMTALWPASFVEEANLTFTVSALRKALGDGHDGEQLIQTVPTRGYRFVAPVTPVATHPAPSSLDTQSRALQPVVRRIAIVALAVAVLAMLPVVVSHLREEPHAPMPASLTIPLPESPGTSASAARISPDGRRVALIAAAWGSRIWLRNIDGLAPPLPIAGTEGAGGWSGRLTDNSSPSPLQRR